MKGVRDVVIGARSAVFAPWRICIIIVDVEHEPHKQEERLCYHASAIRRAWEDLLTVTVLLGSATPSLESFETPAPASTNCCA